jgi:hypothetical protein
MSLLLGVSRASPRIVLPGMSVRGIVLLLLLLLLQRHIQANLMQRSLLDICHEKTKEWSPYCLIQAALNFI